MKKVIIFLIFVFLYACSSSDINMKSNSNFVLKTIFIYKTKVDYYYNVPINMTEDRKRIISYPHPRDLIVNGELSLPVRLAKGFLLDNRGVTKNTVFLKMTYEEYSNLDSPLSLKELKELVIDYYPITVLYDCGKSNDYDNIIKQLNKIIINKEFHKFQKIQ